MPEITVPIGKVRSLGGVQPHRELTHREWLQQNRDQLALLLGDSCLVADVIRGNRCRRPEYDCALGSSEVLADPAIPIRGGRSFLIPEYLKALRFKSIVDETHAIAVGTA